MGGVFADGHAGKNFIQWSGVETGGNLPEFRVCDYGTARYFGYRLPGPFRYGNLSQLPLLVLADSGNLTTDIFTWQSVMYFRDVDAYYRLSEAHGFDVGCDLITVCW